MKAESLFRLTAVCALLLGQQAFGSSARAQEAAKQEAAKGERIVSIGGAVTEILYALGMKDRIVGVDSTSLFPVEALKEKPNVGYMRQLSPEGVLSLNPNVVIASEGAGPKEVISVLEASSVSMVHVPEHFTADGILERINVVAAATHRQHEGACLAASVAKDLAALSALRARIDKPVRVMFILSLMNGRPMVAGGNTAADGVLKLAGAVNAVEGFDGYKIMSEEAIVAAKPDVILVMQRQDLAWSADEVFAQAGLQLTPAAAKKAFLSFEGLYLLGFGPRTARAARDLSLSLYPQLGKQALPSDNVSESCAS